MATNPEASGLIRLCGLWKNTAKGSGRMYLSGRLGTAKVLVFPVKGKKKDTDPDYTVVLAPWVQSEGPGQQQRDDDEVPF